MLAGASLVSSSNGMEYIRLLLLLACRIAIALLAQFYPKKYPDNWVILLVCLIFYSLGTAALSLFTSLIEEDSFLITKPKKVKTSCWTAEF